MSFEASLVVLVHPACNLKDQASSSCCCTGGSEVQVGLHIAVPGLSPCWLAKCYAVDRGYIHVGLHIAVPGSSPYWLANCHAVVMVSACILYCCAGLSPCWLANCYAVDRGHVHVGLHIAVPGSSPCWLANCHAVVMSMSACILYCCAGLESNDSPCWLDILLCRGRVHFALLAVPKSSSYCVIDG